MKTSLMALCLVGIVLTGCETKKDPQVPQQEQSQQQLPPGHPDISGEPVSAVAGVRWSVPQGWSASPPRRMRVATYDIPAASGDTEGGECGVFYFGSQQGGDVQMNIDRWIQQFKNPSKPEQSSTQINGMKVVTVKVAGTFLAPAGPMMESTGEHENYRLLGAIVTAPEGSVFFKLTGPAKTIGAAEKDFNSLLQSLRKD